MWAHDCGSLPVVDAGGRVVAMVTDRDICMAAYTQGKRLSSIHVATAMSKTVATCNAEDAPIAAERQMREKQVRRMPVVDNQHRLVGIVSLNDIVLEPSLSVGEMAATLAAICRHRDHELAVAP
jgi:CBS domain-containing protein